jgi:hypothetical protein
LQAATGEAGALRAEVGALKASLDDLQATLQQMEARALAAEQALASSTTHPASTGSTGNGAALAATSADGIKQPAARNTSSDGTADGGGSSSISALSASLAAREAEVAVLRHRMVEADKSAARLREVFKERAAAFREAVYGLFGYR